jgi:hypothetical protein
MRTYNARVSSGRSRTRLISTSIESMLSPSGWAESRLFPRSRIRHTCFHSGRISSTIADHDCSLESNDPRGNSSRSSTLRRVRFSREVFHLDLNLYISCVTGHAAGNCRLSLGTGTRRWPRYAQQCVGYVDAGEGSGFFIFGSFSSKNCRSRALQTHSPYVVL